MKIKKKFDIETVLGAETESIEPKTGKWIKKKIRNRTEQYVQFTQIIEFLKCIDKINSDTFDIL